MGGRGYIPVAQRRAAEEARLAAEEEAKKAEEEERYVSASTKRSEEKLERLEKEHEEALAEYFGHHKQTNGQPMHHDGAQTQSFWNQEDRLFNKVKRLQEEIEKQKQVVDRQEMRDTNKANGLNRRGTGLEMSVQNIPNIRATIEAAARGESYYSPATIRKYKKELKKLEAIAEQTKNIKITKGAQKAIDSGLLTQWRKYPNVYFVNSIGKVAVELTPEGTFKPSKKFAARTEADRAKLNEIMGW